MVLKPLNDYLLVELIMNENVNLVVPDGEQRSIQSGHVVSVPEQVAYLSGNGWSSTGDFLDNLNLNLSPGTLVHWRKYADNDATFRKGDKTLAFIKFTDLVGYESD